MLSFFSSVFTGGLGLILDSITSISEKGDFESDIRKLEEEFDVIANSQNDKLTCFYCNTLVTICPKCSAKRREIESLLQTTQTSPKIKQKPMIRKRKRIAFSWEDLENDPEDENDKDFAGN